MSIDTVISIVPDLVQYDPRQQFRILYTVVDKLVLLYPIPIYEKLFERMFVPTADCNSILKYIT